MADTDNLSGIGDALRSVMSSPEFSEILSAVSKGAKTEESQTEDDNGGAAVNASAIQTQKEATPTAQDNQGGKSSLSIPPDILDKLPSMLSALSGMGLDPSKLMSAAASFGSAAPSLAPSGKESGENARRNDARRNEKQRKALLTSLRPYLNERRRGIVDNMMKLEGLTGLLETVMALKGAGDPTHRR